MSLAARTTIGEAEEELASFGTDDDDVDVVYNVVDDVLFLVYVDVVVGEVIDVRKDETKWKNFLPKSYTL